TKWVEETLDLTGGSGKAEPTGPPPSDDEDAPDLVRRDTTVEVNGKRFDVSMWVPDQPMVAAAGAAPAKKRERRAAGGSGGAAVSGSIEAPMQGTIVKIMVEVGQEVEAGAGILVLEAMKMENQINAETSGTVKEIKVAAGDTVGGGDVLAVIE
ncbi:MAG: biotin/lipoyl-containing protein, partial [Ilumatobacter sp.]